MQGISRKHDLRKRAQLRVFGKFMLLIFSFLFLIGCSSEEKDWARACQNATVESYESFMEKYPQSSKADIAMDETWTLTERQNSFESYETFLEKYPGSKYAKNAKAGIRGLMESIVPAKPEWSINSDLSVPIDWPDLSMAHSYVVYWSSRKFVDKETAIPIASPQSYMSHRPENQYGSAAFPAYYRVAAVRDSFESKLSDLSQANLLSSQGGKKCQICGAESVGRCHLRDIYVCSNHSYFTDKSGTYWRCP